MTRMLLVSADGHGGALPETYRDYLDPRFRDSMDQLLRDNDEFQAAAAAFNDYSAHVLEVVDPSHAMRDGGVSGAYDLDVRLREMDREGVAAEVLIPQTQCALLPFFAVRNKPSPADLRLAGTWAYQRWLAEFVSEARGRVLAVATPGPCLDMEETVRLLKWSADRGFVATAAPGVVDDPDLPPLTSPHHEPFWAACAELGLAVVVHAGHGRIQGEMEAFTERLAMSGMSREEITRELHTSEESPFALDMLPRRVLWQLMVAGVFDRHPGLQLVFTEVRADWLPATIAHLDERIEGDHRSMRKRPSEYWQSNCRVGLSFPHRAEIGMRHAIGVDRMMFGRDYPHPEGTWPNTWDWIRDAFRGVPEDEARLMVGLNAVECFRLDRTRLEEIAARIGPEPGDLVGDHEPLDPELVEQFSIRGGYTKPAEKVDPSRIDRLLGEDLRALA